MRLQFSRILRDALLRMRLRGTRVGGPNTCDRALVGMVPPRNSVEARGNRSVAIGGDAKGTTILTGDHPTIRVGLLSTACTAVVVVAAVLALVPPVRQFVAGPTPMKDFFNAAVTDLRIASDNCQPTKSDVESLSRAWFDPLKGVIEGMSSPGSKYTALYYPGWGADDGQIGSLGRAVEADVVVSGDVTCTENSVAVTPRVYVTGRRLVGQDAVELIGIDTLGGPVQVIGDPFSAEDLRNDLVQGLTERSRGLADVFKGLATYPSGDWPRVRDYFRKAINTLRTGSAASDYGLTVSYLFSGKAATQMNDWSGAREDYGEILKSRPNFLRAELGLAEVDFQEVNGAKQDGDPRQICRRDDARVFQTIVHVIDVYKRALESTPEDSDVANLRLKSHFYLGRAYTCLGLVLDDEQYFTRAFEDYQALTKADMAVQEAHSRMWCSRSIGRALDDGCIRGLGPVVQEWAAEAYAGRGLILFLTMNKHGFDAHSADEADRQFARALELATSPARRGYFVFMQALIARSCERYDSAESLLTKAGDVDPASRPRYEALKSSLRSQAQAGGPVQQATCAVSS